MPKKSSTSNINPSLKKLFIVGAFGAAVAQIVPLLTMMIQQYPTNRNMSGFYTFLISSLAAPLVYFAISYFSSGRIKNGLDRIFYSTVLSLLALFVFTITWQAIFYAASFSHLTYDRFLFDFIPFFVPLIALVVFVSLTRSKL